MSASSWWAGGGENAADCAPSAAQICRACIEGVHSLATSGWPPSWCAGAAQSGEWLQVSFPSPVTVSEVEIQGRSQGQPWGYVRSYNLKVSMDAAGDTFLDATAGGKGRTVQEFASSASELIYAPSMAAVEARPAVGGAEVNGDEHSLAAQLHANKGRVGTGGGSGSSPPGLAMASTSSPGADKAVDTENDLCTCVTCDSGDANVDNTCSLGVRVGGSEHAWDERVALSNATSRRLARRGKAFNTCNCTDYIRMEVGQTDTAGGAPQSCLGCALMMVCLLAPLCLLRPISASKVGQNKVEGQKRSKYEVLNPASHLSLCRTHLFYFIAVLTLCRVAIEASTVKYISTKPAVEIIGTVPAVLSLNNVPKAWPADAAGQARKLVETGLVGTSLHLTWPTSAASLDLSSEPAPASTFPSASASAPFTSSIAADFVLLLAASVTLVAVVCLLPNRVAALPFREAESDQTLPGSAAGRVRAPILFDQGAQEPDVDSVVSRLNGSMTFACFVALVLAAASMYWVRYARWGFRRRGPYLILDDEAVGGNKPSEPNITEPSTVRRPKLRPEVYQALAQLDERLLAVLGSAAIRLVRAEWLLKQPDSFQMPSLQGLQLIEREGASPSPLLSPEQAVALVRRGQRSVAVLSHGWLSPGNPDPSGVRLRVVRSALEERPDLEAIFWDYSSLFQNPLGGSRTAGESAVFHEALEVMGDLYASAIGTTVLQLKEIPPRPPEFDGALCLFNVADGVGEADIRSALERFGTIVSCDKTGTLTVVRFSTHEAAIAAAAATLPTGFCSGMSTAYNERSYDGRRGDAYRDDDDGRGWCCFESSVSSEVTSRLAAYPKLRVELEKLPPKLLLIRGDAPTEEATGFAGVEDLSSRVDKIVSAIEVATFTGAGDKIKVVGMYKDYVARIAGVLQNTLTLAAVESPAAQLPGMPNVVVPKPQPLLLADGQLVLSLSDRKARADGSEGGSQIGVISASRIALILGDVCPAAYDGISQVVLPWQPPIQGWDSQLLLDVKALPALYEQLRALNQSMVDAKSLQDEAQAMTEADEKASAETLAAAEQVAAEEAVDAGLRDAMRGLDSLSIEPRIEETIRAEVEAVLKALEQPDGETQGDRQRRAEIVRQSLARIVSSVASLAAAARAALRATGAAGAREYACGQLLTVRLQSDWVDAVVTSDGFIRLADESLVLQCLHPWNHAPRMLPASDFEVLRQWWEDVLRLQHSFIADALTGRKLDVLQQCVAINLGAQSEAEGSKADIDDARSLSAWLRTMHAERCEGGAANAPVAALLTGPPAAGKTSLISQVIVHSLDGELVPVLLKAQQLQRMVIEHPDAFSLAWNWVDAFLKLEHGEPVYSMLRQALASRRVLVILDGLDEGGALRERIERHVAEVLAPQGHVILATSRPAGLETERFADFCTLTVAPLSDAQQREAVQQRLGGLADALLAYIEDSVPCDETGRRVTSNPLMLSMVASLFELRQGVGMPSTVAELYKHASQAMLSRGAIVSDDVRRLLQAAFFEAHVTMQRVITKEHLVRAAEGIGCRAETLTELEAAVVNDQMPLLSLLQTEPLQLQSSHLSFQEYFAAVQLCEPGTRLEGAPPWHWSEFWSNAVALGADLGQPFAAGVLRAAGVSGTSLDLSGRLGTDQPMSLRVVMQLATCLTNLDVSHNLMGPDGAIVIGKALEGNGTLTSLNLKGCGVGPEGAVAIGQGLEVNRNLTALNQLLHMPPTDQYGFVWSQPDSEPTEEDLQAEREIEIEFACRAQTPPRRRCLSRTIAAPPGPIVTIMLNSSGRVIGCADFGCTAHKRAIADHRRPEARQLLASLPPRR